MWLGPRGSGYSSRCPLLPGASLERLEGKDEALGILRNITLRKELELAKASGARKSRLEKLVRPGIWVLLETCCTFVQLRGVAEKKVDCCVFVCAFCGVNMYPMGNCVV